MYFDVWCVQDSNGCEFLWKNIEMFSFFEISQKVKLLDLINVSQTHVNMAFAQILSYSTKLNHQKIRKHKHKGVKTSPRVSENLLIGGEPPSNDIRWLSNFTSA